MSSENYLPFAFLMYVCQFGRRFSVKRVHRKIIIFSVWTLYFYLSNLNVTKVWLFRFSFLLTVTLLLQAYIFIIFSIIICQRKSHSQFLYFPQACILFYIPCNLFWYSFLFLCQEPLYPYCHRNSFHEVTFSVLVFYSVLTIPRGISLPRKTKLFTLSE